MTEEVLKLKKSERTRLAILASARAAFSLHGYDQMGVREIAAKANVTGALVNRYFGTKQALFREVLQDENDYSVLYEGPREEMGRRFARFLVEGPVRKHDGEFLSVNHDLFFCLVRSVGSAEAMPVLREYLAEKITGPLMEALPGERVQEKASILISHFFGFLLVHSIIGAACTVRADRQVVEDQLAASFQAVIDS